MRKHAFQNHKHSHVVVFDVETIVSDPPANAGDGFIKWPHHRPVVASFLTARSRAGGEVDFKMESIFCRDGDEQCFYQEVEARLPDHGTVVSLNGRGFDSAVLGIGGMAARRFSCERLSRLFRAHRFGGSHCDLADAFSNYRAATTPSLAEICGRLQIPVKTSAHGSEVADLHARGRTVEIAAYCEEDVAATYLAWLHWVAFRDSDESLIAEPLAAFSKWIERSPHLGHLMPIAKSEPARWARRRAVVHRLRRVQKNAEVRVSKDLWERRFSGELLTEADPDDIAF